MSIPNNLEKIKVKPDIEEVYRIDENIENKSPKGLFIFLTISLSAALIIGIFILSSNISNSEEISIIEDSVNHTDTEKTPLLVGSVKGSKYHFPWCSGAKRISEANLIKFASYQEASAMGYEKAGNCKGLE